MIQYPDYSQFTSADFLEDSYFLAWMRQDNREVIMWWTKWLGENPSQQLVIDEAKHRYTLLVSFKKNDINEADSQVTWQYINNTIEKSIATVHAIKKHQIKKWMSIAAAAVAAIILTVVFFTNKKPLENIITATNSSKRIVLEDGSVITLKKNAELRYFNSQTREIWINGEGYFEINKALNEDQKAIPFIVHAAALNITVTGTTFSVASNANDNYVILSEGKVTVDAFNNQEILNPGDKVEISGKELVKTTVNPQLYAAWKDGEFRFNNTTMAELKPVIKAIYGLDIVIENEGYLKHKLLNGSISAESIETFMNTLAVVLNADVNAVNNQLLIKAKK
jgi:transmembrane sensor